MLCLGRYTAKQQWPLDNPLMKILNSHLYHGLLINLIRRSDCQIASVAPFNEQNQNIEGYWRLSVEAEQKRR
jgi:hypothetical protein